MGTFKKGDYVRAVNSYHGEFTAGKLYQVSKVCGGSVSVALDDKGSTTNGWGANNFEPWQPKVGERVRVPVSDNSVWVGEGIVDERKGSCFILEMKTGENTGARGGFYIDELEPVLSTEAPLTIVAGRYYKTRDGRKVGPVDTSPDNFNVGIDFFGREAAAVIPEIGDVDASGFWLCGDGNSDHDLIAEWHEPTTNTAAQVDTIADEYGPVVRSVEDVPASKPKFKVGDRVTKKAWDSRTGWEVAEISDKRIGLRCEGFTFPVYYGLPDDEFILAGAPTPAIVALIDGGLPKPSTTPKVHLSQEDATKEAARLAELHKGQEFGVFVLAGATHKVERTVEPGDKVTVSADLRVTSVTRGKANVVVNGGGSFTLPVSALTKAA